MRSLGIAVFAGVVSMSAAMPASALTISGDYFEDTASINCANNVFNCQLPFPVLPSALTGKFVVIETVSCTVAAPGSIVRASMFITDNGTNPRRTLFFTPPPSGTLSFSGHVGQKVSGGPPRQMFVQVDTSVAGSIFVSARWSGRSSASSES